jgi:16S rRNA (guanine527-N7)-methyltransferase
VGTGVEQLVSRYALPADALGALQALLELLVNDPTAPTAVRAPDAIVEKHFADALVALELEPVRTASTIADLGSGAGIPGLPLAVARPSTAVALVESSGRKAAFLERAVAACRLSHVSVINVRVEAWPAGLENFELVTARAVAPLAVVVEYAAPLLVLGGHLVAWRGKRDQDEETAALAAARELAMEPLRPLRVEPYPGSRSRHLHAFLKAAPTPAGFPRRPGIARKRPLGRRSPPSVI